MVELLANQDGLLETGFGYCTKNTMGIVIVTVVYTVFVWLYFMTVYFGMWHQSFGLYTPTTDDVNEAGASINTICYTFFWLMMMWCHIVTVLTKPGYLPREKEQLQEDFIPVNSKFYDIIKEREDIYHELVVRKKLRQGSITAEMHKQAYADAVTAMVEGDVDAFDFNNEQDKKGAGKQDPTTDATFKMLVEREKRNTMDLSIKLKRNTAIDRVVERRCYTCNSLQPPYVFHCSTCKRCVAYMDHHCPWVNNCVGYYTQKPFILFCFYGMITTLYSCIVMTTQYKAILYGGDAQATLNAFTGIAVLSLTLAWLGFLFIMTVFFDQIVVVLNRLTVIERIRLDANRLKGGLVEKRGYENFRTAFGSEFGWRWFIPLREYNDVTVEDLYS